MPKRIDPIRLEIVKQARMRGMSRPKALRKAGYSEKSSTHHSADLGVVKRAEQEIMQELKKEQVTVDFIIKRLNEDRDFALAKEDYATATRVDELLGKYLAMFTDKYKGEQEIITKEEAGIVDRLFPRVHQQ